MIVNWVFIYIVVDQEKKVNCVFHMAYAKGLLLLSYITCSNPCK